MNDSIKAYVYLFFVVILWGSAPSVVKLMLKDLNNFQVLFYMLVFAAISLFLVLALQRKLKILKGYSLRDYFKISLLGCLGVGLYHIFLFKSFMISPVNEAMILNYIYPIAILIFSVIILKENIRLRSVIGIILGFFGVCFVISGGNLFNFNIQYSTGYLLAISAGLIWGFFSVLGKKLNYETFSSMFVYILSALILTTVIVYSFFTFEVPTLSEVLGLAYLGVLTVGIAFVLWFKSLKLGETVKISNLVYLTPFVSLVFIHFIIGEKILLTSIFGLVLIIIGVLVQGHEKS